MAKKPAAVPPLRDQEMKRASTAKQLKSWISLNMDKQGASGSLTHEPLSPLSYQFLLRRSSAVIEEQIEEAILAIGCASTAIQFRDTVLNALFLSLFNVKHSKVFLLHSDSNELVHYESEKVYHPLQRSGILWKAVRTRSASIIKSSQVIEESDPFRQLNPDFKALEENQVVLINPIVEKVHHEVIALMTVVCDEPSVAQVDKLRWLERNVHVAAIRTLKHISTERERKRAESMLRVCSDLIDMDTTSLAIKILKHVKNTLDVKMCFLFLISESTQEIMCPVQNDVPLEKEIRIELNSASIYSRCFLNGEAFTLDDVSQDARFNPSIDAINGYEPSSMMCLPIKTPAQQGEQEGSANLQSQQQAVGVAVVCDKTNGKAFSSQDQEGLEFVLHFCSSVIANTLAFQRELTLKKQNQALLQMAKNLFSQLSDLNTLLREIMNEARSLTKAERCSLFLLDQAHQELVAAVFDSDLPNEETIRIKVGQGIAGLVAQTGRFVNIKDAYKHPQFFREVDESTGFRTRNMLCFPIKDHQGHVVGVAELCNKIGGNFFTKFDEELATTFSVYCGISLYQSQLYKKMEESRGRSKLATELMIYHMQVFSEDVDKLTVAPIPTCESFNKNYSEFFYSPRSLPEADTIMAVLSMMNEMNLLSTWKIQRNTLARFLLMVKKGYRDPPYHNWSHALSVTHFCYLLHHHCDHLSFLSPLEVLALFVSCLCHDIDHRGTNNAFQVSSNSVLASLYSSEGSVMERHHFAQTACILNSEGCNVFENLSHTNYKQVLDLIQYNILSTDIAHHLRLMKEIDQMAATGYEASSEQHHKNMCSLLMTASDLSSTCKEWKWSKKVSDLIYAEFFTQGDLELALGHTPSEMMDRNKAFVPEQQLGFLDHIAGPAYKVLAKLLPKGAVAYSNLLENRAQWEKLAEEGRRKDSSE